MPGLAAARKPRIVAEIGDGPRLQLGEVRMNRIRDIVDFADHNRARDAQYDRFKRLQPPVANRLCGRIE